MGNCLDGNKKDGGGMDKSAIDKNHHLKKNDNNNKKDNKSTRSDGTTVHSIHGGMLRERKIDVYQKYREVEVLGTGSMGHVAKVVVREGEEGGSAYRNSTSMDSSSGGGGEGGGVLARVKSKSAKNDDLLKSATSAISERRRHHVDYALKSIQLDRVSPTFVTELKNEIEILKTMDHPNIVRLHEVYYHKKQIYMILELCDGGDLYTRLPYTEKDSAYITGKLLSAVKYMHDHGIVHRDLKFENIMFENKSPEAEVKVIDFGLSKKFVDNKIGVMREGVGTLYSMAPQVLQGVYTSQADMWSVGVITYMLLSSHRPFYNKKRKIMIDRIMRCDYTFEKDYWKPISDEAKDFISHLLVLDPKVRYKAEQAQKHKWMHKEFKIEDRAPSQSITDRVAGNLMFYKDTAALKKIALNVIAHRSSTNDIIQLRKAFDQFDTANNGVISFDEFKEALKDQSQYSDEDIKSMFDSIDVNHVSVLEHSFYLLVESLFF